MELFLSVADFIAPKYVCIVDVKPPVCYGGIGPCFGLTSIRLLGRRKMALLVVPLFCSLDQRQVPIFSVEIKEAFGIAYRCRCDAALFPFDFSGGKVGTHQGLSRCAVQVLANLNCPADAGWQFGCEIDLLLLPLRRTRLRFGIFDLD